MPSKNLYANKSNGTGFSHRDAKDEALIYTQEQQQTEFFFVSLSSVRFSFFLSFFCFTASLFFVVYAMCVCICLCCSFVIKKNSSASNFILTIFDEGKRWHTKKVANALGKRTTSGI